MNLVLLEEGDRVEGDVFEVRGRRARHIEEVLRAESGRTIRVGLLEGPLGTAVIELVDADRVRMTCSFEASIPERPLLDLVLAIPRPKSLKKLLPEVTALGVDRLVLFRTWRVAKPFLDTDVLGPEVYRPLLHEGMMQARTTREPAVVVEPLFRPFVEDRAPGMFAGAKKLVAHPAAERDLASLEIGERERVALVVGPEGGLIPFEIDALAAIGFLPVTMGPRPLRVETAAVALLAQIDLLRRQAARG